MAGAVTICYSRISLLFKFQRGATALALISMSEASFVQFTFSTNGLGVTQTIITLLLIKLERQAFFFKKEHFHRSSSNYSNLSKD